MYRNTMRVAALVMVVAACANTSPPPETEPLGLEVRDSAGVMLLELSHTLHEVARGQVDAVRLSPELSVGGDDESIGMLMDVASLRDGRFAVIDRMERSVIVYDSLGQVLTRFGREGKGPGEYVIPVAVASTRGGRLVVWDRDPTRVFTVLAPEHGTVLATVGTQAVGDWARPYFRHPLIAPYGDQQGPEDVTRRLRAYGPDSFIHHLQEDEHDYFLAGTKLEGGVAKAFLIRYDSEGQLVDTLAVVAGAQTEEYDRFGEAVFYREPIFSGRPIWAAGEDWLAIGHGDSASMVVRSLEGDTLARLTLPARREHVTEEDRLEAARWEIAIRLINSKNSREMFEKASRREQREAVRYDAENYLHFADLMPTVSAAYAHGECLFLAGPSATDWADGTALTWVAVNVVRGTLEGVLRLEPPAESALQLGRRGAAVRDFDGRWAYVLFRDDYGFTYVQRYRLPEVACESGRRRSY